MSKIPIGRHHDEGNRRRARGHESGGQRNGQLLHFTVTPAYDEKLGAGQAGWMQESQVQVGGYLKGNDAAEKAGLQKGDIC